MDLIAEDDALTMLVLRLFNARAAMQRGEPGQRARFFSLLTAIGDRRRHVAWIDRMCAASSSPLSCE